MVDMDAFITKGLNHAIMVKRYKQLQKPKNTSRKTNHFIKTTFLIICSQKNWNFSLIPPYS